MSNMRALLLLASAMASFNPTLVSGEVVGAAPQLYFVDAHSQADAEVSDLGLVIRVSAARA